MGAGQKILVQYAQGFADGMKSQLLIGHRFLPIRIGGALRFQGSLKIKSAFGLIPSNFISIEGEFRSALLTQDCDLAIASPPLRATPRALRWAYRYTNEESDKALRLHARISATDHAMGARGSARRFAAAARCEPACYAPSSRDGRASVQRHLIKPCEMSLQIFQVSEFLA